MKAYIKQFLLSLTVVSLLFFIFSALYVPKETSKLVHEILALIIVPIVIYHVIMMKSFFSYLKTQRSWYFYYRDFVVIGLMITLLAAWISGLIISKVLFKDWWFTVPKQVGRPIHNAFVQYALIFIGLHLGMYFCKFHHWLDESFNLSKGNNLKLYRLPSTLIKVALVLVSLHGLKVMSLESYWQRLSFYVGKIPYDKTLPAYYHITDQLSVMAVYVLISALITYLLLCYASSCKSQQQF